MMDVATRDGQYDISMSRGFQWARADALDRASLRDSNQLQSE
jgi:hypothetical protein